MARTRYEVDRLPPPWRRSLTESGMRATPTSFDRFIVLAFFAVLLTMAGWLVTTLV